MNLAVEVVTPLKSTFLDYPSSDGSAVVAFLTNCDHSCPGCHNQMFSSSLLGELPVQIYTDHKLFWSDLFQFAQRCNTDKIVLEGGDPLHPRNREFVRNLLAYNYSIKGGSLSFCVYTGYTFEEFYRMGIIGANFIKCGRYDIKLAQGSGKTDREFRLASTNQELYDRDLTLLSFNGIYKFPQQ